MLSWIKKNKTVPRTPPSTPENTRIYAIGDIHGRFDLLKKLHALIEEDAASCAENCRKVIVYIGDYIDRGLESKQVIESFISENMIGFERIFIKGNHEDAMLSFLGNSMIGEIWFAWGGYATVQSYGTKLTDEQGKKLDMEELRLAFQDVLPESHLRFLQTLKVSHIEGDYLFVHAGIKPGIALDKQLDKDMMIIRDEFIFSEYPSSEKTVVFGHTIFEQPFHKEGKIAIDTGAYATGRLTAVVLENTSVKFIST